MQMLEALGELIKRNYIADELRLENFYIDRKQVKLGTIPTSSVEGTVS